MRRSTWLMGMGAALALAAGQAALAQTAAPATPAAHPNSQQEKMSTCNADATSKGLKGDDRKSFMKTCLSHEAAAPAKGNSQQEKMKTCNADATSKGLKGDDRKTFMSHCLSASG
jgi:hypothetical protein